MPDITITAQGVTAKVSYTVPASNVPNMQAAPRPTGPDYVAIESLGVPLTGAGLKTALAMVNSTTAGKILTLPPGDFVAPGTTWDTTNRCVWRFPSGGFCGLVGSGPDETRITFPEGGLTRPSDIPTASGSTNPYHTFQAVSGEKFRELGNLSFVGNAGHYHGGIRIRNSESGRRVKIWKVKLDNCAPGNYWSPPGETFGISTWHVGEVGNGGLDISDIWGDGRNNCSSLVGLNNTNNSVFRRVHIQNAPYGMPTWWKCTNIDTDGITSIGNHAGINMEEVGGTIIHRNITLLPNRNWPTAGANKNCMHTTFQSDLTAYVADRVEFHDIKVDTGLRGGCLMLMSGDTYNSSGSGLGQQQNLDTVHVYHRDPATGVEKELTRCDTWVSGNPAPDPTKYWYAFH